MTNWKHVFRFCLLQRSNLCILDFTHHQDIQDDTKVPWEQCLYIHVEHDRFDISLDFSMCNVARNPILVGREKLPLDLIYPVHFCDCDGISSIEPSNIYHLVNDSGKKFAWFLWRENFVNATLCLNSIN